MVKVPEEGLAGGASGGVALVAPERPERGPTAFDRFVVGHERLEDGQDLEAGAAIELPTGGKQGE